MAKKKLYRTVFTFTVLSPEPLEEGISLTDIDYETDEGQSIRSSIKRKDTELIGKVAVNETYKLGSMPDFFFMDEDGNEKEEEDES